MCYHGSHGEVEQMGPNWKHAASDNKTRVDCLRLGISTGAFSQACIRNILHFATVDDFQIRAVHIDGCKNSKS